MNCDSHKNFTLTAAEKEGKTKEEKDNYTNFCKFFTTFLMFLKKKLFSLNKKCRVAIRMCFI